ncbi:MAG: TPM domain-containing protein [Saccharofermentans sp.]|jgi:predicted small lipoprotein YifL|nr:TPM domain-containing protein [Saccharofermentans sp.]
MKKHKLISILAIAALSLTAFAGCGKKAPPPSSAVIATTQATVPTTEPLAPVINRGDDETEPTYQTNDTEEETTAATTTTEEETTTTEEPTPTPTPKPKPTSTPAPTPSVKLATHVKDEANVIKDDAALEAKLVEFEKATKIIPVVYTVKTNLTGDDFRTYTKNIYKNNFKDQNHFLIVYRVAKNGGGWSWTTSIGSKAYSKLRSAGIHSTYSNDLSKALSGNKDRGKGFISFFDKAQKKITGKE